MQLVLQCPRCEQTVVADDVGPASTVQCASCEWSRSLPDVGQAKGTPSQCLACDCTDLWRQKDFPVRLGLLMVTVGAVLSTLAWNWYRPLWAIGILMGFALVDLVLFALMPDVLVCYRCGARHRHPQPDESIPRFDLEVAERYRQESARLEEATSGEKKR